MRTLKIDQLKKILLLTSSGGGGLLQAAMAKEQEIKKRAPQAVIIRKDVLQDWMGQRFGTFCSRSWNQAQIRGDVAALDFYIASQRVMDFFCWPYLFLRTLHALYREKIDHVIDTQPLGTSAIVKAIRIYNAHKKKRVYLQKVLVDFPTKLATHFFGPIRRLTRRDRPFLQLSTIVPLLKEGETEESFWQTTCRLTREEIHYELNVRQSFRALQERPRDQQPLPVTFCCKSEEELQLMQRAFCKGGAESYTTVSGKEVTVTIPPHVKVFTILLGSQPASRATLHYVEEWLRVAKECCRRPTWLFVFSAEHRPLEKTLFRDVVEAVEEAYKCGNALFSVIPFSFQSDAVIAPLFHRSDLTCTRSGGQTAMELLAVNPGEIWIHSETKEGGLQELLKGIPGWEAANALYLQEVKGAKIVSPETFAPFAKRLMIDEK
ncbi:MAG: hypothetical protein KGI80_04855 [Verrucomicrobiota bacterium]|nr:hypothetical protein [Verrucomicrobiota bacterium]